MCQFTLYQYLVFLCSVLVNTVCVTQHRMCAGQQYRLVTELVSGIFVFTRLILLEAATKIGLEHISNSYFQFSLTQFTESVCL